MSAFVICAVAKNKDSLDTVVENVAGDVTCKRSAAISESCL